MRVPDKVMLVASTPTLLKLRLEIVICVALGLVEAVKLTGIYPPIIVQMPSKLPEQGGELAMVKLTPLTVPLSHDAPLISLMVNVSRPLIEEIVSIPWRGNWPLELGVLDCVSVTLAVPVTGVGVLCVGLLRVEVLRVPLRVPV